MSCHFRSPSLPIDPFNNRVGADFDVLAGDPFSKSAKQVFVSVFGSERTLAFNLFLCPHALNQPVRTNNSRIGRIEASHVSDCALPGFLQFWIAIWVRETPLHEIQKRFVWLRI